MVIAGVVAGYLIAWAIRKAKRIGNRLDTEADAAIDASLDRLHEVVAEKLTGHPVMAELVREADAAAGGDGGVSDLTRQELVLALTRAAQNDNVFGNAVTELVARLQKEEKAAGRSVIVGPGSTVFTGDASAHAEGNATAIAQAGVVNIEQRLPDPPPPGRISH